MCYAKPGPRCSRHAAQAVEKATDAYQQSPTMENLVALRHAENVYNGTPAGLKAIQERIDVEEDPVTKEALIQFHALKKAERQVFLDAYRFEQRKKQAHRERLEQESRANTPEVLFEKCNVTYNSPSETRTIPASLMAECDYSSPTSPTPTEKGISVVYDYYGCAGTCGDDYICRDGKYSGLRVEKFDSREYLAYRFGVGSEDITDEMVAALDAISPADYIDLDVMGDYYGEQVTISAYEGLDAKVREIYRGIQGAQK